MSYHFDYTTLGTALGSVTQSIANCASIGRGSSSNEAAKQVMKCAADAACAAYSVPPGVCSKVAGPAINTVVKAWDDFTGVSARRKRRQLRKMGAASVAEAMNNAKLAQELMEADLDSTIAGLIDFRREVVPSVKTTETMGTNPVRKTIDVPGYGPVTYIQYADDNPMRRRLAKAGVYTGPQHEIQAASLALSPPRVFTGEGPPWVSPRDMNHICVHHTKTADHQNKIRKTLRDAGLDPTTFFDSVCQHPPTPEFTHARMINWRTNIMSKMFDESLDRAEIAVRNEILTEAARELAQQAAKQAEAQRKQAEAQRKQAEEQRKKFERELERRADVARAAMAKAKKSGKAMAVAGMAMLVVAGGAVYYYTRRGR